MVTMSGASSFGLRKRGKHKCQKFVSKLIVSGEDSYELKWALVTHIIELKYNNGSLVQV
jgi:hypothetical protein